MKNKLFKINYDFTVYFVGDSADHVIAMLDEYMIPLRKNSVDFDMVNFEIEEVEDVDGEDV